MVITDEPVESSRLQESYRSIQRNLENIPQIHEEEPKDVNMQPV